jgi:hemolysin activation/secretion protein
MLPRIILFLMFSLIIPVSEVWCITLNLPVKEDEKDIKYKDWVIQNKNIPPVKNRNPDPSKGPRIPVKEFKVQGVKSYPDLSINKDDINKIIEEKRYDMMDEKFLQESGYTIKELLELAQVLSDIDKQNDGDYVELPDVQKLIWLLKEQKNNRGLTIGEIEEISESITTYYRQRGFFLAKAFVPAQDVNDGVVGLTILEGVLGQVKVAGNSIYQSDYISGLFDDVVNKAVVYENIEQKLYLLNDFPGLKLSGYFKPGSQIGDTQLNLNIISESNSSSFLRIDNYGSEYTGTNRLYYQFQWNNPAGYADRMTIGVMQTSEPDNTTYGSLSYRAPVGNEKNYLSISHSNNQYAIDSTSSSGLTGYGLNGVTTVSRLSYEHVIKRTRKNSTSFKLNYQESNSEDTSPESLSFAHIFRSDATQLSYQYDLLSEEQRHLNNGVVTLSTGDFYIESAGAREGTFDKINIAHHFLKFSNIPFTTIPVRWIVKTAFQYSDKSLPPTEQTAVAGPDAVRAYPVTQYSADSSIYLGLELHTNYPKFLDFNIGHELMFSRVASPFIFIDGSFGIQRSLSQADDETAELSGWGVGLEVKYKDKYTGHIQIAYPEKSNISNAGIAVDSAEVIIVDFQYNF